MVAAYLCDPQELHFVLDPLEHFPLRQGEDLES